MGWAGPLGGVKPINMEKRGWRFSARAIDKGLPDDLLFRTMLGSGGARKRKWAVNMWRWPDFHGA